MEDATMRVICDVCHLKIKPGEQYRYLSTVFCENCYMDKRANRARKTHWQYLKSIKTEYLKPGKK
ncbi:MAG: hypothetical protein GY797_03585 [Deltaproteobacteria bacterium]|nr:hypothetical protein [Deltaproteobacteria bacterium]